MKSITLANALFFAVVGWAQEIKQTSEGWCSPNVANTKESVTIVCHGIPPEALKKLNELLDLKNKELGTIKNNLTKKIDDAEKWARRYRELEASLATKGSKENIARQAKIALKKGDLNKADELNTQLEKISYLVFIEKLEYLLKSEYTTYAHQGSTEFLNSPIGDNIPTKKLPTPYYIILHTISKINKESFDTPGILSTAQIEDFRKRIKIELNNNKILLDKSSLDFESMLAEFNRELVINTVDQKNDFDKRRQEIGSKYFMLANTAKDKDMKTAMEFIKKINIK